MPPKKRARVVTNAGGSPPAVSTPKPKPAAEPVFSDGWTDEQETTLFKAIAIYKLKPAGLHKHFRVIGIAELMKNHGVSSANTDIPGIWKKLDTLYNLEELDEREDEDESVFGAGGDFSGGGVSGSGSATESVFSLDAAGAEGGEVEFGLPWDTFGELMMARRIDPSSLDSPRLSEVSLVPTTTNDDDAEEMVDEGEGDDEESSTHSKSTATVIRGTGRARNTRNRGAVRGRLVARVARGGRPRGRGRGANATTITTPTPTPITTNTTSTSTATSVTSGSDSAAAVPTLLQPLQSDPDAGSNHGSDDLSDVPDIVPGEDERMAEDSDNTDTDASNHDEEEEEVEDEEDEEGDEGEGDEDGRSPGPDSSTKAGKIVRGRSGRLTRGNRSSTSSARGAARGVSRTQRGNRPARGSNTTTPIAKPESTASDVRRSSRIK